MVMKIQVVVFWVVPLGGDVVSYQCFRGPCCLNFHAGILPHHYMV